jgi:hypothetical protein
MNALIVAVLLFAPQGDQIGTYAQELAAAKRAGYPVSPADMKRPPIPESENAAPLYVQFAAALKSRPLSPNDWDVLMAVMGERPTSQQIDRARSLLASRKSELALVHRICGLPKCQFDRDWSRGPGMLFPEYSNMRSAARLLMAEGGVLLRDGHPQQAVDTIAMGFRIAEHAQKDSVLIGHLVAIAIDAITLRGMEIALTEAWRAPGMPDAVRKAIETKWRPRSLAESLRGEIVMEVQSLAMIRNQGISAVRELTDGTPETRGPAKKMTPAEKRRFDAEMDSSGAHLVHLLVSLANAADKPFPQASQTFKGIADAVENRKDLPLVAILVPVFRTAPEHRARVQAKAEVMRAAAAAFAWKQKHNSFPASLSLAMNPAPLDPFDLRALRYRQAGHGFTVFSIGRTGKFAGEPRNRREARTEAYYSFPMPLLPPEK